MSDRSDDEMAVPSEDNGASGPGMEIDRLTDAELGFLVDARRNGISMPKPFETDITLLGRTYLAGTGTIADADELALGLHIGDRLPFRHARGFGKDDWAVKVIPPASEGGFLGLIRAHENELIARLLDAGKAVYGIVEEIEWVGDAPRIWIEVRMDD